MSLPEDRLSPPDVTLLRLGGEDAYFVGSVDECRAFLDTLPPALLVTLTVRAFPGDDPAPRHAALEAPHVSLGEYAPRHGGVGTRAAADHLSASRFAALTAREREVAELVSEGMTNSEIAERLFVATSTVKKHLTRVYRKLRVTSRAQMIRLWLSSGRRGR